LVLSALEIFLLILFILVLIATIIAYAYFVRNTLKEKLEKEKKEREIRWKCQKYKEEHRKKLIYDYYWSNPNRFFYTTLGFIFLIAFSITTSIYYFWFGFILTLFFGILYAIYLKWAYDRYMEFPKLAKAKLEEYDNAIKEGIKKAATWSDDDDIIPINSDKYPILYFFDTEVKKFNYPPLSSKKTVISEKKIVAIAINRDFLCIFDGASKFNLLNPAIDEKKGCEVKKPAAGGCKDFMYQDIRKVTVDGKNLILTLCEKVCEGACLVEEKVYDVTFTCTKPPEAKEIAGKIKNRIKALIRQKGFQVLESYAYKSIQKMEEEKKEKEEAKEKEENKNEENNQNNDTSKEKQESNKNQETK
jgi:membrane protein implicated in regulation of membrane protease activity